MDRATVERLRAHEWGADPFERAHVAGEPYRIRLVNGRCFFLDQDNRCRIHREISYEAKPSACRAFPLAVLEIEGTRYGRLSFWCPTVTANDGKLLAHQSRWLRDTAKQAERRTAPLIINDAATISRRDFEVVHQALRRFVVSTSLSIGDGLAAASTLIQRLNAAATSGDRVLVERVVRSAESEGAAALAREARLNGDASGGRRALSLFLLQDRDGGRWAGLARFVSILMFNLSGAALGSRAVRGRASWRQLCRVAFDLTPVSTALLTRYFSSKLDSRRYIAGDAALVDGFNVLLAAYGVINVLARMRAASEGRPSCGEEDIRLAVGAADLLVVEHPNLYHGRFHRRLTQAALGSSRFCGDILACLEDGRFGTVGG